MKIIEKIDNEKRLKAIQLMNYKLRHWDKYKHKY